MKLETFNKFKKMMARTTSESDPEAMAALRAANRILEVEGITWDKVLDRSLRVEYDVEPAPDPIDTGRAADTRIQDAFAKLDEGILDGSFGEFIESLREQWQRKGTLSFKQREALFKAAEKVR